MEISRLVLQYLQSLAWPLIALIALLSFRKQIVRTFPRVAKLDAFGTSLEFAPLEQSIERAKRSLSEIEGAPAGTPADIPPRPISEICDDLLQILHPRAQLISYEVDNGLPAYNQMIEMRNATLLGFGVSPLAEDADLQMVTRTGISAWVPILSAVKNFKVDSHSEYGLAGLGEESKGVDLSGNSIYLFNACDEIIRLFYRVIEATRAKQVGISTSVEASSRKPSAS